MFAPTFHFLYIERWSEISSLDFLFNTVKSFSSPKRLHCAIVKLCSSIRLCSKAKQSKMWLILFVSYIVSFCISLQQCEHHWNMITTTKHWSKETIWTSVCNPPTKSATIHEDTYNSTCKAAYDTHLGEACLHINHISPISMRHLEILRCLKITIAGFRGTGWWVNQQAPNF